MGCLAKQGHTCVGVDISEEKVSQVSNGAATIIEKDIDWLIADGWKRGLISATTDASRAVDKSDLSFICVGTPNAANGHLDLNHVYTVAEQIGIALATKKQFHIIAIRSTVPPGTNDKIAGIIERYSGRQSEKDFAVVSNPEFLREGSAVADYFAPGLIVIGSGCERAQTAMKALYEDLDTRIECVSKHAAELIKYVSNSFHALKIAFANEIGNICRRLDIDSHEAMDLFLLDTKLNISGKYLKPGFAYGGSCLPKDLRALQTISHDFYLESPVIENIERSNLVQKQLALDLILEQGRKSIAWIGLSFKSGTDDLRNSPSVELIERLLGKGYSICIYDRYVHVSNLRGTNKVEIERRIPHFSGLVINDLGKAIDRSEMVVFAYAEPELAQLPARHPNKLFIDLVRVSPHHKTGGNYIGLSW
jgi:GDP-mannose 6-dehydrogenase